MFDPIYLVTIFAPFVLYYLYERWTYKGPPHVTGLPLLGYIPFLGKESYITFQKLMDKHGPIFSLYLGSHYSVILGNYDLVHEAFIEKGNVFSDRPPELSFKVFDYEIAFSCQSGEQWKVLRNFTMNTLKNLGFGKNFTKNFVQMEIQNFIDEMRAHKGRAVNVDEALSKSMMSLILSLFTGKRYDRSGWASQVSETAATLMKVHAHDVTNFLPWIRKLPIINWLFEKRILRTLKYRLWSLLEEETRPLKTTFSSSTEQDNFIHSWYAEQDKRTKNHDPHEKLFSDFSLTNHLDMLVEASSDTTSTTLLWAFLYLVLHQDIQRKLHEEIDEYIGQNREPMLEDAGDMQYTKSFLAEVHRMACVAPFGLFHSNNAKSTLKGFEIPKHSAVICNFWTVNHDPKYFPDPYTFDPERHLDDKKKFKSYEYFSAFSFGRRLCPGKQVAEMQLFLYLTSILQAFELRLPPGSRPNAKTCVYDKSLIRRPVPYEIVFAVRNQ